MATVIARVRLVGGGQDSSPGEPHTVPTEDEAADLVARGFADYPDGDVPAPVPEEDADGIELNHLVGGKYELLQGGEVIEEVSGGKKKAEARAAELASGAG